MHRVITFYSPQVVSIMTTTLKHSHGTNSVSVGISRDDPPVPDPHLESLVLGDISLPDADENEQSDGGYNQNIFHTLI